MDLKKVLKDFGLNNCQCDIKENRKEVRFGVLYINITL